MRREATNHLVTFTLLPLRDPFGTGPFHTLRATPAFDIYHKSAALKMTLTHVAKIRRYHAQATVPPIRWTL